MAWIRWVDEADAEGLLLDIPMMTALFAYFNRIADGLGIELEAPYQE